MYGKFTRIGPVEVTSYGLSAPFTLEIEIDYNPDGGTTSLSADGSRFWKGNIDELPDSVREVFEQPQGKSTKLKNKLLR